jgi:NADH:ubiquinone oxidoreductase subunit 3 (subunit A)
MSQYLPVLVAFAFAGTLAVFFVVVTSLFRRGRLDEARRRETYESGMPLLDAARKRFSIKFFVVAMVFIVFDIEVAFLIPWAVAARGLLAEGNTTVLLDGLVFLVLLAVGYAYLWREGAFDWSRRETG